MTAYNETQLPLGINNKQEKAVFEWWKTHYVIGKNPEQRQREFVQLTKTKKKVINEDKLFRLPPAKKIKQSPVDRRLESEISTKESTGSEGIMYFFVCF